MNEYDVKRLALVLAVQAEIEGMKAANIERQNNGEALAYDEKAFADAAEELRVLACKRNDQLNIMTSYNSLIREWSEKGE